MQLCYNFLHQHPYDPTRPFGSLIEAKRRGMATVTMRTATSGTLQRWVRMVNPADTFDYTAALIQFVLSNPLVDVALVGMRDVAEVDANVRLWRDVGGRIDIAALHARYVQVASRLTASVRHRILARASRRRRTMALSRTTRVNLLLGNGHFLSHFYSLCLPPLFLAWQSAFDVSFAELGLAVALMSGASAMLQTPVGFLVDRYGARPFLIGGALLMSLCITTMGFATSFWQILVLAPLSGMGNSVFHPADYAILSGSVDKDRMGRAFALHTFSGNLGFAAAPPVMALLAMTIGWRASLIMVGLLGVPVAISILLQSGILKDQVRHETDARRARRCPAASC